MSEGRFNHRAIVGTFQRVFYAEVARLFSIHTNCSLTTSLTSDDPFWGRRHGDESQCSQNRTPGPSRLHSTVQPEEGPASKCKRWVSARATTKLNITNATSSCHTDPKQTPHLLPERAQHSPSRLDAGGSPTPPPSLEEAFIITNCTLAFQGTKPVLANANHILPFSTGSHGESPQGQHEGRNSVFTCRDESAWTLSL